MMWSAPALITLAGLLVLLAAVVAATTPRGPRLTGGAAGTGAKAALDFTRQERESLALFQRAIVPPTMASLLVSTGACIVMAVTPIGAGLINAVGRLTAQNWWVTTLLGSLVLLVILRVVTLPWELRATQIRRAAGLLTQGWGGWTADRLRSFAVGAVVTCGGTWGLVALMRVWPLAWWIPAGIAAAGAVVVLAFIAPVVVEPLFLRFTKVPEGPVRDRMLDLARRAGVQVRDVLVADASRRSTALNAYVSGFGPTRRIVIFDSLSTSPEVDSVVAHELGHARERDVLRSVVIAAVAAATGVVTLAVVLMLVAPAGAFAAAPTADPRLLPLVFGVATVLALISGPGQAAISRRVEARADLAALDLTGDPAAFIAMMRQLALSNQSSLTPQPWRYRLLFTHPTAPMRMAFARAWAVSHGLPSPPPMAVED